MKIPIKKYKIERVIDEEFTINIPEKEIYFFITGIRVSVKVIPIWTKWNQEHYNKPEEIWKLKFVLVYGSWESKIESFEIQISNIADIISGDSCTRKRILDALNEDLEGNRTKEQFETDFRNVLNKIQEEE